MSDTLKHSHRNASGRFDRKAPVDEWPALRILHFGLDWLQCSTHNMLRLQLLERSVRAKAMAEKGGPVPIRVGVRLKDASGNPVRQWMEFEVQAHGTKNGFGIVLRNSWLTIFARRTPVKIAAMPNVMFHVENRYLHGVGFAEAYRQAALVVAWLTGYQSNADEFPEFLVNRVDLFVDVQGFNLNRTPSAWFCGPPTAKRQTFERGRSRQGVRMFTDGSGQSLGKGVRPEYEKIWCEPVEGLLYGRSGIVFRAYDKRAEIAESSGKRWFETIWAKTEGYSNTEPVTRIEFQLRGDRLRKIAIPGGTIRRLEDVMEHYGPLWHYLCGIGTDFKSRSGRIKRSRGYVSLKVPTGRISQLDRYKWQEHPWWKQIRTFVDAEYQLHRTEQISQATADSLVPQAAGVLSTIAALSAWYEKDLSPEQIAELMIQPEFWSSKLAEKLARRWVSDRYRDELRISAELRSALGRVGERDAVILLKGFLSTMIESSNDVPKWLVKITSDMLRRMRRRRFEERAAMKHARYQRGLGAGGVQSGFALAPMDADEVAAERRAVLKILQGGEG